MAYRLPNPWGSGYAIPNNVRDEGLQRQAIVTKWAPRGTYDNPPVGNNSSGFATPNYVLAEGYGQGARATRWLPSGTYVGPAIPNPLNQRPQVTSVQTLPNGKQRVTVVRPGMGDTATPLVSAQTAGQAALAVATDGVFPEPWGSYGVQAATAILSNVSKLPPGQRKTALKKIMNSVDPTLYRRTAALTKQHLATGMAPAQALHKGLSRAMTAGILNELHQTGKSGTVAASGQLGLGVYGVRGALGDIKIAPPRAINHTRAISLGATALTNPSATIPASSVSSGAISTTATASQAYLPGVSGIEPAEGAETSDGKLVWSGGNWRIAAPSDTPSSTLSYDSSSMIAAAKIDPTQTLYVGTFPFNVNATGPYVTMLTTPSQFDQRIIPWMASMMQSAQATAITKKLVAQCNAVFWNPNLTGACNACMSASSAANCQSTYAAVLGNSAARLAWTDTDLTTTNASSTSSQGNQQPATFTTTTDSSGNPCRAATFPGNSATFQCYSMVDWLTGAGITKAFTPLTFFGNQGVPGGAWMWGCGASETGLVQLFNSFQGTSHIMKSSLQNGMAQTPSDWLSAFPPMGTFIHPISNALWGVWIAIVKDAGPSDANECPPGGVSGGSPGDPSVGAWNETTDKPYSYHFEIGFAPMSTVTTWQAVLKDVLEAIFYVPGIILTDVAAAVEATLGAIATLACDVANSPGAAAGLGAAVKSANSAKGTSAAQQQTNNIVGATAAVGLAIAQGLCGGTTPAAAPVSTDWTTLLLIGGAIFAATMILTRPRSQ